MNNSEGQTQEPVGGMDELTDKFIQTMTGNCENEAYCQREDCKWKGMVVCFTVQEEAKQCAKIAFEYFTPPPAPISVDFNLAREAIQTEIKTTKEYERYCKSLENLWRDIDFIIGCDDLPERVRLSDIKNKIQSFNKQIKL